MSILGAITGSTEPVRYELRAAGDGAAWLDVDKNGTVDDSDAYLTLATSDKAEYVDFQDLKRVLAEKSPQDDRQVMQGLGKMYGENGFESIGVVNGGMCFDMVSTYRNKQTYAVEGDKVFLTLTPDADAPYEKVERPQMDGTSSISLVEGSDGVLRWEVPEPPPAPPPDPNALTEATLVERDGVLHWLFPGEVVQPGDKVRGNTDTYMENLSKG